MKKSPDHPGIELQKRMDKLGLSVAEASFKMKVSRKHLHQIINGTNRVTPGMALRLGVVLGPDAAWWVQRQAEYDMWWIDQQPTPTGLRRHTAAA
jgi:addiction module HigA family antidote